MPPCCRALCEDTTVEKQILILLAAYKGGRFIRPMVDSILAQDVGGWRLILSDDGEDTAPILQEYADKYPDKITHYRSGRRFGSAQKHFMHLLEQFGGQADYIMFSDQDDVWHPDKVRLTLRLMEQAETDPALPVLVHTDLRVVDGQLHEMDPSFQHYSGLDGHRLALEQLLVQNVVTGCTMMINRSLARLACRPVGEGDMLMHDWWLALIAAAMGRAVFLDRATIDYRQHGGNVVGAKDPRSAGYVLQKLKGGAVRRSLVDTARQAGAFLSCYRQELTPDQQALLADYAAAPEKGKLARLTLYRAAGPVEVRPEPPYRTNSLVVNLLQNRIRNITEEFRRGTFTQRCSQLSFGILCLFLLECSITGGGRYWEVGPVSIRILLGGLAAVLALPELFRHLGAYLKKPAVWADPGLRGLAGLLRLAGRPGGKPHGRAADGHQGLHVAVPGACAGGHGPVAAAPAGAFELGPGGCADPGGPDPGGERRRGADGRPCPSVPVAERAHRRHRGRGVGAAGPCVL